MWIPVGENEQFIYDIFEVALDIEGPWKLMNIEFDEDSQAWYLYLDFKRGATFRCPLCGSACKVYDTSNKKWRHLDFWDWKTYFHARVSRVKCHDCRKVTTPVPVSWSRPIESQAMRLMAEMPVLAAA